MVLHSKPRNFRDWCPQPPDRLPNRLKRYSVPIAAIVTASIVLSFFVFSSGLMSNMSVLVIASVNVGSSTNPTLLWSYTTGGAVSTPSVVGGTVYVGSSDQKVYALNATNGSKLWINGDEEGSSPAVANGVLYIGGYFAV